VNLIAWLLLGVLTGWATAILLDAEGRRDILNVTLGVCGAVAGGLWISSLFEAENITQSDFSISALSVRTSLWTQPRSGPRP
jgi:uncharacterized membrane protein YeaQ/YmgE (transglycosylase-associated protein family)